MRTTDHFRLIQLIMHTVTATSAYNNGTSNNKNHIFKAILLVGLFLTAIPLSVVAHTTQVSGNIAGTWHIEPNHSPKAGEPAQVWIALTKVGGELVPLEQCACQLTVYTTSSPNLTDPLLEPLLRPTTSENYEAVPGAEIVFPKVGLYELKLSGTPKAGADFQPFELRYSVTVAAGASVPQTSPTAQVNGSPDLAVKDKSAPGRIRGWMVGSGVAIALLLTTVWITRRNQSSRSGTSQ